MQKHERALFKPKKQFPTEFIPQFTFQITWITCNIFASRGKQYMKIFYYSFPFFSDHKKPFSRSKLFS